MSGYTLTTLTGYCFAIASGKWWAVLIMAILSFIILVVVKTEDETGRLS